MPRSFTIHKDEFKRIQGFQDKWKKIGDKKHQEQLFRKEKKLRTIDFDHIRNLPIPLSDNLRDIRDIILEIGLMSKETNLHMVDLLH